MLKIGFPNLFRKNIVQTTKMWSKTKIFVKYSRNSFKISVKFVQKFHEIRKICSKYVLNFREICKIRMKFSRNIVFFLFVVQILIRGQWEI